MSSPLTPDQIEAEKQKLSNEDLSSFPSIFQQARNLVTQAWISGVGAARGVAVLTTPEKAAARLEICQACEFYRNERCLKCGCFMSKKAHVELAGCPENKWGDLTTVISPKSNPPQYMQIDITTFPEDERAEIAELAIDSLRYDGRFAYNKVQYKAAKDKNGEIQISVFYNNARSTGRSFGLLDTFTQSEKEQFRALIGEKKNLADTTFTFKNQTFKIIPAGNGSVSIVSTTPPAPPADAI